MFPDKRRTFQLHIIHIFYFLQSMEDNEEEKRAINGGLYR